MRNFWTAEDIEILKEMYPHYSSEEVAQKLNRTVRAVYSQARLQKLSKTPVYQAKKRQNEAELLRVVGANYRFKKGDIPINKGKKQTEYMTEEAISKTAATRFKKGLKPHNHTSIGHTRITKDGYIMVKVAEPNKFKLLHRFIWKIWNGDIPAGCNIAFKDGNTQNCDISNLYLKTKAQNMADNTIQRYPAELIGLMKLNKKLTKKINDYGKK